MMQQFQQESKMSPSQSKTRSLTGPLILITIGVLFLVQNLAQINIFRVIWPYWPVILIVIGIGKLLEYFRSRIPISR